MNYLFVNGSLSDNGGYAMIRGAINGINLLDKNAFFAAGLPDIHAMKISDCKAYIMPQDNEAALNWANIILDVGGWYNPLDDTYWQLEAQKRKIPFIWMSQSFGPFDTPQKLDMAKKILPLGFVIARGKRSAEYVKQAVGKMPVIAPDLSFLIRPKKWSGKKYKTGYTTHSGSQEKDVAFHKILDNIDKENSIQIIWKKEQNGYTYEPSLPIDKFSGTIEECFGLIETLNEFISERYQGLCAAIVSNKTKPIPMINNHKYEDLMDFCDYDSDELKEMAFISCYKAYELATGNL